MVEPFDGPIARQGHRRADQSASAGRWTGRATQGVRSIDARVGDRCRRRLASMRATARSPPPARSFICTAAAMCSARRRRMRASGKAWLSAPAGACCCPLNPVAPEFVWPAQLDAVVDMIRGIRGPVILAGDSAGGHLRVVSALELARRGRPIAGLVLFLTEYRPHRLCRKRARSTIRST